MNDHQHYSIQHQHQTNNRHHLTLAQRTTLANRPELRNIKSQEINDNSLLNSNYTTGTQPQHITTTDYPDCFTPIVSDSRQKKTKSTLTPRSHNSKILTRTTNQQQKSQNHHDPITPSDTSGLPARQSIIREHRNDDRPHDTNRTHKSKSHEKLSSTPTLPITSTPTSANCGRNTPASQLLATMPESIKHRIVRVRRKNDTASPRFQTQLCTPLSIATPLDPPGALIGREVCLFFPCIIPT